MDNASKLVPVAKPKEGVQPIPLPEGQKKVAPINRITVVESVYHQNGMIMRGHQAAFFRLVGTDEQIFERSFWVGEDWAKLDLGWYADKLGSIGMLVIVNQEGKFDHNPTEEEKAEAAKKLLVWGPHIKELDKPVPFGIVPPGETARYCPVEEVNDRALYIKSLHGKSKYRVVILPS